MEDVADVLHAQKGADVRVIVIRYDDGSTDVDPERWLVEGRAPVDGLLDVREARGALAVRTLERWLGQTWPAERHLIDCTLTAPSSFELPLGWTLSDASKQWMDGRSDPCVEEGPPAGAGSRVEGPLFRAANVVRGWLGVERAPANCLSAAGR